jgi:hypothetical protein
MNHRPLRSAMALSLGALLAFAGGAAADTAKADGDVLTPDIIDAAPYLTPFAPGEVRSIDVRIVLTCTGFSHMDPGQTITAGIDSATAPDDGAISATDATVGPVPAAWPADGTACPLTAATFSEGTPSVVTLRAPTTPGTGYKFSLQYHRSFDPFGLNDPLAIRQLTAVDFLLDVVVNTPPALTLPAVAGAGPVEANTTGGWTADWSGLGATDAEDAPDPTATCDPAAGAVLSLGTTSVTCGVTDGGGMTDGGTFDVTVQDTTAPTLTGMPGDRNLTTGDPSGTTLTYARPGATDTADADPAVACLPASGSHLDLGTTKVTCTATDASGNKAQASFDVGVTYVAPHTASATWGEPVAGSESTFVANRGRNIPVKVELFVDGVARSSGEARLTITPCGGGDAVMLALIHGGGRWNAALDTTEVVGSCHTVAASIDGLQAGAFRLELRGTEPAKANNQPTTTTTQSTKTKTDKTKP